MTAEPIPTFPPHDRDWLRELIVGALSGDDVIDLGECALLPGLVDTHVHVNEPGRTEWEGFATATRAAAAGGVTTIVDMPLNSHPADRRRRRRWTVKRAAAAGQCHVDVGFWGGAVPGNAGDAAARCTTPGVFGFKAFLIDSGVPEFPPLDPAGLRRRRWPRSTRCSSCTPRTRPLRRRARAGPRVRRLRRLAPAGGRDAGRSPPRSTRPGAPAARVHILHLSAAGALPLIAAARGRRACGSPPRPARTT